jgi:NADH-quinone oxidoreductase subunit G
VSHQLRGEPFLIGSEQFAKVAKVKDNDLVEVEFKNQKLRRVFKSDITLKGTIALAPTFDLSLSNDLLFSYRYQIVKIHKVVE